MNILQLEKITKLYNTIFTTIHTHLTELKILKMNVSETFPRSSG